MGVFDKLTVPDWKRNCELAQNYFRFLTDELVEKNKTEVVTYQRLNKIMPCKQDCNFDRLLSVNSSFTANMTAFARNAISLLSSNVSCKTSAVSKYIVPPQNAADLINNISKDQNFNKYCRCDMHPFIVIFLRSNHSVESNRPEELLSS